MPHRLKIQANKLLVGEKVRIKEQWKKPRENDSRRTEEKKRRKR